MQAHETTSVDELSDDKRCLLLAGGTLWIYRQPGGCVEIGQRELPESHHDSYSDENLLVHICEEADVTALIGGLQGVMARVPARF